MEGFSDFENREQQIDRLIEEFAAGEGIPLEDVLIDIVTFLKLSEEDEDAKAYFEDMAGIINIPLEEAIAYARKKAERYLADE